jgi:hypothetical protein
MEVVEVEDIHAHETTLQRREGGSRLDAVARDVSLFLGIHGAIVAPATRVGWLALTGGTGLSPGLVVVKEMREDHPLRPPEFPDVRIAICS